MGVETLRLDLKTPHPFDLKIPGHREGFAGNHLPADPNIYDGRWSNVGWLQELPSR